MCMCVVEVDSFQYSVLKVIVAMYVCVRVFVCLLSILRLAVSGTRTTGQLCFFLAEPNVFRGLEIQSIKILPEKSGICSSELLKTRDSVATNQSSAAGCPEAPDSVNAGAC